MADISEDESWKTDWREFVRSVDDLYLQCRDNRVVTNRFANQRVCWTGTVEDRSDAPELRSVDMRMEAVGISSPGALSDGVSYLVLKIDDIDFNKWKSVPFGSVVRFETTISAGNAVFPGILYAKIGVFRISTAHSRVLEVL